MLLGHPYARRHFWMFLDAWCDGDKQNGLKRVDTSIPSAGVLGAVLIALNGNGNRSFVNPIFEVRESHNQIRNVQMLKEFANGSSLKTINHALIVFVGHIEQH